MNNDFEILAEHGPKAKPNDELAQCIINLKARCLRIKIGFLHMYQRANAGHVGSSLSCAEILTLVRFGWMEKGDEWILSKGHAAAALYSTLAEAGDLDPTLLTTFYKEGTWLPAHPPPDRLPGVRFGTGSLGHGLSLAAGVALGMKLDKNSGRVFCVTSDGELNEGSTWEAALFSAHHKLSNLIWLIDRNRIQGFGRTEDTMALDPLRDKLVAFGFEVAEAQGHDFDSLLKAKHQLETKRHRGNERPGVILCHTVKGKGMGALENTVDCHYLPLDEPSFQQTLERLRDESRPEN